MATMAEISAAINLIDVKKQNLHQSFLHLQSQSPSSFNSPLNWADLDSYFTALHSSLQSKFNLLQTFRPPSDTASVPARPELKSFCENSDGLGLNRFIALAPDRLSILSELPDAYRFAPDAPAMVLDAVTSFYSSGFKGAELRSFRSGCSIMLYGLLRVKPDVSIELKDKAMEMAVQWNQIRVSSPNYVKTKEQEVLGFLRLVGAYGLVDRFTIDEIIDCFLIVAKHRYTIDLCRRIIPENNINDMIQKLIDKDMHVNAVNFIIELQKTDEFPPVGLLEDRILRSMRVIEETCNNIKDLNVCNRVTMEEISVLKSIIKCIDENHLESEYPKDSVVELVNKLQNELENSKNVKVLLRKQPLRAVVLKRQLLSMSKMSTLNKVQPTAESAAATPVQSVKSIQESRPQESDLSPDHLGECHVSPLGSGPASSNAPSTKESVVEIVNKLGNEVANSKQTPVNGLGLRKQPARAAAVKKRLLSKSKLSKKSKKRKLNKVQPTPEPNVATPVQNFTSIQEPRSQKSDSSPDHVGGCHSSPPGSGPTGSNAPSPSPIGSSYGPTRADIDYSFYVPQLQPPSDCNNSNGWISE